MASQRFAQCWTAADVERIRQDLNQRHRRAMIRVETVASDINRGGTSYVLQTIDRRDLVCRAFDGRVRARKVRAR